MSAFNNEVFRARAKNPANPRGVSLRDPLRREPRTVLVMITLHEIPISPYARKVKLVLLEKGLAFERRKLSPRELDGAEFGALNPRREVPALVDEGVTIVDSTIICEYLEERYPEPALYPKTPAGRARARMLEDRADVELEPAVWALMEIHFFGRASGELAEKLLAGAKRAIDQYLDLLESELSTAPFLTGDHFGIVDAAFLPHVAGAAMFGVKAGAARPHVVDWVKRLRARPSVQTEEAEVRASIADGGGAAEEARQRPRQYRDHRLEWMLKHGGFPIVEDGMKAGTIRFSDG
jgi:glutathione S-transferase